MVRTRARNLALGRRRQEQTSARDRRGRRRRVGARQSEAGLHREETTFRRWATDHKSDRPSGRAALVSRRQVDRVPVHRECEARRRAAGGDVAGGRGHRRKDRRAADCRRLRSHEKASRRNAGKHVHLSLRLVARFEADRCHGRAGIGRQQLLDRATAHCGCRRRHDEGDLQAGAADRESALVAGWLADRVHRRLDERRRIDRRRSVRDPGSGRRTPQSDAESESVGYRLQVVVRRFPAPRRGHRRRCGVGADEAGRHRRDPSPRIIGGQLSVSGARWPHERRHPQRISPSARNLGRADRRMATINAYK